MLQYDSLPGLVLPGKKAFNNMSKEFLEKRKVALNAYLQVKLFYGNHSDFKSFMLTIILLCHPPGSCIFISTSYVPVHQNLVHQM